MSNSMKGNYATQSSQFLEYCKEASKRAYLSYDANESDREGRKWLTDKLNEEEENTRNQREECIQNQG